MDALKLPPIGRASQGRASQPFMETVQQFGEDGKCRTRSVPHQRTRGSTMKDRRQMLGRKYPLPRNVQHVTLKDLRVSSQINYDPSEISWSNPSPVHSAPHDSEVWRRPLSSVRLTSLRLMPIFLASQCVQVKHRSDSISAEDRRRSSRRWVRKTMFQNCVCISSR
eukprot:SAG11_NODE_782_length_7192_cov_4.178063_2_plen_166_part_00